MASKTIQTLSKQSVTHAETYVDRPRRVCSRKSYCEEETDDEFTAEDVKQYKPKGSRRKESYSFIMLEKKQRQIAQTLRWLGENYELKEGMCLPRCVMYTHYLDFCRKGKLCPAGPATFGKIIRQRFPKLTTRRLGTRGQSKYHYYGIVVKETSAYFHAGYSKKGLSRFSGMKGKGDANSNHKKFSLSSKSGTLLPEFPKANTVQLPDGVSIHKVETFIMMYRTHCQRMLDTVVSANFEGVQNFITHFWQGMPSHIISVLECPVVVDIVAICDSILYKVLTDVLIPSTIQDLPDSLREEITEFAENLLDWLDESLTEVPLALKEAKFEVARIFAQALKRQVCFVHLAQAARSTLLSYEDVSQMLGDLRKIDFGQILSKSFFISGNSEIFHKAKTYVGELESLLSKQAPLEAYIEWLDSIVDRCVLKESEDNQAVCFEDRARKFLAMWSFITARVLADLTLRSAPSFGVFHLIHTAFEEYVFLVVENQMIAEMDKKLNISLETHLKKENPTLVPSIERELDKPKENMQPERRQDKPKETSRVRKQKIATVGFFQATKQNIGKDKTSHQQFKKAHANVYQEDKLYITTSAPSVTYPSDEIYQTAPLNNQPRQMVHTTPLNAPMPMSFAPLQQCRSSLQPIPVTDLEPPHEAGNVPEINAFQGDFINAIDKSFLSSRVTLNPDEYMGAPWVQNEPANLTVLNPVSIQEHNPVNNGAMNFPGNGNYPVSYDNNVPALNVYSNAQTMASTPRPPDIPYISPTKDDFGYVPSITNIYPRYNAPNYLYDPMRNAVQPNGSDVMGFNGLLNTPASSFGMDGIPVHDIQLNRLGIGAV
ncbi:hypothetical protein ACROYT_G017414 [Oculina patagonica]